MPDNMDFQGSSSSNIPDCLHIRDFCANLHVRLHNKLLGDGGGVVGYTRFVDNCTDCG